MEIINLGKADGLPPVDWAAVAEKLAGGPAAASHQVHDAHDVAPVHGAAGACWADALRIRGLATFAKRHGLPGAAARTAVVLAGGCSGLIGAVAAPDLGILWARVSLGRPVSVA